MSIARWDSCHSRRLTSTPRFVRWGWPPPLALLGVHEPKKRYVTVMSMLFNRTAIIPVWLVMFALLAIFGSPMPLARAVFLLIVGVVPPTIMLTLWREPSPRFAEVLHHLDASRTE